MEVFEIDDLGSSNAKKDAKRNRHKLVEKFFKNPDVCIVCREYIWGLNAEGFQCQECDAPVHATCIGRIRTTECSGQQVTKSSKSPQIVVQRVEPKDKEPLQEPENDFGDDIDEEKEEKTVPRSRRGQGSSIIEGTQEIEDNDRVGEILKLARTHSQFFYKISNSHKKYQKPTLNKQSSIGSAIGEVSKYEQKKNGDNVDFFVKLVQQPEEASKMLLKDSVEEDLTDETNDLDASSADEGEEEDTFSNSENDDDSLKNSQQFKIKNIYELSLKSPNSILQQSASSSSVPSIQLGTSAPTRMIRVPSDGGMKPILSKQESKTSVSSQELASSPEKKSEKKANVRVTYSKNTLGDSGDSETQSQPQQRQKSTTVSTTVNAVASPPRSRKKATTVGQTTAIVPKYDSPEKTWLAIATREDVCLNIHLQLNKEEFQPGDEVEGSLFIDLLKPLENISGVKILIQGFEKAFRGYGPLRNFGLEGHILPLWEPTENDKTLAAGQHTWTFSFSLPINLPPTIYFEDFASIFYQIRGYVDPGPTKRHKIVILSETLKFDVFGIHSKMWKNVIKKFSKPVSSNFLSKEETVRIRALVDRKDFYVGEKIPLRVKLDNQSEKKLKASQFKVSFIQTSKLHVRSYQIEFEDRVIFSKNFEFKGFKLDQNSAAEKVFEVMIPDDDSVLLPTTTGVFMTVQHYIKVAANVPGMKPLIIPVRIWDSLWDSDEQVSISRAPRPSVSLAPSDWSFQVVKVWMKPLTELPVNIDLPRLAFGISIVDLTRPDRKLAASGDDQYVEAIFDYSSKNIVMSSGDTDLSFKKNDLFRIIESCPNNWLRVDFSGVVGVVPSDYVKGVAPPTVSKEERLLRLLTMICQSLEGEEKMKLVQQNFWKYIPRNAEQINRDISRELNRLFKDIILEESPSGRILKACSQSIIAPPVIEMTLNIAPKLPFKDGGGWKLRITIYKENVQVTHWKSQKHLSREPGREEFRFEWELSFTFNRKVDIIEFFSFKLSKLEFSSFVSENRRLEITEILQTYFTRGPSKEGSRSSVFPTEPSSKDTAWIEKKSDESEAWKSTLGTNFTGSEKFVSKFFGMENSQKLRELDFVSDNWHVKLLNLNQYNDEDDDHYQKLGISVSLEEKIRRKWNKPLSELLVATILPYVYQKIEITTAEGLIRLSEIQNVGSADQIGKSVKIRKLLETMAILLHDTKESLPALIKHFKDGEVSNTAEASARYLGKFFQEFMRDDLPTIKGLKCVSLSVMSLAFNIVKDYFATKFPITDIGAAWKINFTIGDGLRNNHVICQHFKAAKSLDSSSEGSFEFLWELKIAFDYELTDVKSVSLQVSSLQVSNRFPKSKLKELQNFVRQFNKLDHSKLSPKKSISPKQQHNTRKKLRQKLRKIPKAELSNPTLRKDCTLHIKVVEAKDFAKKGRTMKKRRSSFLNKSSNVNESTVNLNPYVVLVLGEQRYRTRTAFHNARPYWAEETSFEVFNNKTDVLKITVWDASSYNSDSVIGFIHIPLRNLKMDEPIEDWFVMQKKMNSSSGGKSSKKEENNTILGSLRLRLKYTEEIVLPAPLYDEMLNLLTEKGLKMVKLLGRACDETQLISQHLIKIFEERNTVELLLKTLAEDEIEETNDPEIIFRGNSFCSRALDAYMRFVGQTYLIGVLSPVIKKLQQSKKSYEIDPRKIEKGQTVEKNLKNLTKIIKMTLDCINASTASCPAILREIFSHLRNVVIRKFSPDKVMKARHIVVSSFIFLRFFCPALTAPRSYNLIDEYPDVTLSRVLIDIAKSIQKLANLIDFNSLSADDDYMKPLYPMLEDQKEGFKRFIDELVTLPENPPPRVRPPIVIERELASLHRYLKKYKDKMIKFQTEDEHVVVKKFCSILEDLEYISQHEKVFEYP